MPRQARLALGLSAVLHGLLILAGRYRLSYDAYVHMFFGDHYRLDWWSLWDPRWYTGFFVNSYPPLTHQWIGALSRLIGIEAAFALLLWLTLSLLPVAVYAFARIFVGKASAGYAALGTTVLPSVYLTAHIFGQLPTLAATVTALFAMAALDRYLRSGTLFDGVLTVSLLGTVMAFHHATLLLLPWLVLAIALHLLTRQQIPWPSAAIRLFIVGVSSALFMFAVIWPFWAWGQGQSMQTPIDHASRHNFFQDPRAALIFFLPMYGPLIAILPHAFRLARKPKRLGPGVALAMLFLLGLGGTTPLPRLFFGTGWEWLTYDRFAFWASLMLLPFFGMLMVLWRRQRSSGIRWTVFAALAVTSLIVGLATALIPLQPGAVDMDPIVDFLEQDDRSRWRYLTFGFGDQLALLSTRTAATTIDGSYHTARSLPELRRSGIAQIDTAYWFPDGLSRLDPILQQAGEHGIRWGFVNVEKYVPVLERNGWVKIRTLKDGVQIWENPHAVLPAEEAAPPVNTLASFSWGTLPMLSLVTSLSLASLRVWPQLAERVLRGMHAFVVALIPLALCFWYYRTIQEFPQDRVYFTYTNALFFLADALVLLLVILWLVTKIRQGFVLTSVFSLPARHLLLPASFLLLSFLSLLWSRDWRTSLYVSLHILLVFLFVLSLREWSQAWRPLLLGFCAALSLQFIAGMVGFLQQSTAFLAPLGLRWPGTLDPGVRGAVIVQLPGGESFLRAYGTLPHPNILGGVTLVLLLGPLALFLRRSKPNAAALLLLLPGIALLALTFSRSAWLALVIVCLILIWKSQYLERKRLLVLLSIMGLAFLATLFPYADLVRARTVQPTSEAEEFSFVGRAWLNGSAVSVFEEFPLSGVGIGSFTIELSRRAGEGYVIEPAHNILLLAAAELGLPGLLLVSALAISLAVRLFKAQRPEAILTGAVLAGLGFISLFDHYLWTLAPGRLLLGLVSGLFLGQDLQHEA